MGYRINGHKIAGYIFRAFVYIFLLLPLIVVICTAFSDTPYVIFPAQGFTLRWFGAAMENQQFIDSIFISLSIAIVSMIFSTLVGTMASLYFWKSQSRMKKISELIFMSPVIVPTVIFAVAFLQFFATWGFLNAYWKLILAYSTIQIPYVIRCVSASLYGLDVSFEEASLVLGASPLRTLFKVILPCAKRGIIGGSIFSFVVAMDEAVIVMFLADARTITYPLRLYSYITEIYTPMVSAFSTLFIVISFIIILLVEKTIGLSKMY